MSRCSHPFSIPARQSGAALLAFALLIVVGTSYLLLKELNVNFIQLKQQQETRQVLEQAKQALIGYAVTYPDITNSAFGPGYFPCPNIDNEEPNDGTAVGNCSFTGQTTIGRFPYKTLETPEFRDGAGERLWYVLSENFRYGPNKTIPLNSETPVGDLTVDNVTDVVAVIIAPGKAYDVQNRDRNEFDIVDEINHYLEGENADLDTVFATSDAGNFNDEIIYITRQELMFAVEKRVLGEVFQTLDTYRTNHSAYPWLSPFTDPAASAFRAQLDDTSTPKTGWQGHIPFHWINDPLSITNDPSGVVNRNPFQTAVSWVWHTDVGTATGSFSGTVTADCLRNVNCDDGLFPPIPTVDAASIECRWIDDDPNDSIQPREIADCDPSGWITMSSVTCDMGCGNSGTCSRSYHVEFPLYTGTSTTVVNQSTDLFRTRSVERTGSLPIQNSAVQIVDIYSGPTVSSLCLLSETVTVGSGNINFTSSTTGSIATSRIHYDIDIDGEELPEWFVDNEWHRLIYVAYAEGEDIPGGSTSCSTDVANPNYPCLTINGVGTPNNNSRGIIMAAGDVVTNPVTTVTQNRTVSPIIEQYFEELNSDQDQVYQSSSLYDLRAALESANPVNDQVKVLATP